MKIASKAKNGFTLIELLIVIAIIAILAAVVAPNALNAIDKSKVSRAEADYKAIKTGALQYYSDTKVWPADPSSTSDPGFMTNVGSVTGWRGAYMEKWPNSNSWGGTYQYHKGTSYIGNSGGSATEKRYIELTNVPQDAIDRLEADIDGGTASATTGFVRSSGTTVDLIISE